MYDTTKITCRRCAGKGLLNSPVVYAGIPGGCFACAATGEVYKDKFYRAFGANRTFYGVTAVVAYHGENPNNGTFKSISTRAPDQGNDPTYQHTFVEITEEQARRFFARYGDQRVKVAA